MELLIFGGGLVQLLIIAAIVAFVVWLIRRKSGQGDDPGIGAPKRVYFYGLSFAALMVAASGATVLLDHIADLLLEGDIFSRGQTQLALGLAMLLVGIPVWLLHWTLAQRATVRIPWESQAAVRRVYIYLVLTISAVVVSVGLVALIRWWLGADSFNGRHLALPLVWGSVWAYHWRIGTLETIGDGANNLVRQLYVYLVAWYGLALLAVGVGIVLWSALRRIYDALFGGDLLLSNNQGLWSDTTVGGLSVALVGALWWWWHWHRVARADTGVEVRQVYLHLFAILPGAGAVLFYLSNLLYQVLRWGLGQPDLYAADHFRVAPAALAGIFTGAGLWVYHWTVARQEASDRGGLPAARRIYRYIVTAVGLLVSGAGIVILLVVALAILGALGEDLLSGSPLPKSELALGVTLLLVGLPVWAYHWIGLQRDSRGSAEELSAFSRRIFFYVVFGAAALLVLGNLSAMLFVVLRDILEGTLSLGVIQDSKWSVAMFLTAGAAVIYHWSVFKEDQEALQEAGPEPAPTTPVQPRKLVVAVATQAAQPLISQIELRLGYPVRVWQRLDPEAGAPQLNDDQLDATRDRITAAPGEQVLITLDASGVNVVPYRE